MSILSIGLFSCNKEDYEVWRTDNVNWFKQLEGKQGLREIGDSINGFPKVYYLVEKTGRDTLNIPIVGNKVTVRYSGYLWNDTLKYNSPLNTDNAFDSNLKGATFTVGRGTIEGFYLALERMPVGSKWRVFIPYDLGYGNVGKGTILPYSTLIFEMELVSIDSDN